MTWGIGLLLAVVVVMVYLFLTEKLPVDLTAFLGLIFLTLAGYIQPDEAFLGFASPAVITMLSIFIVSASLLHTGVADVVGGWIHRWLGDREVLLMVTLMLVAGILSAFMNNIAATAVLMPAVAGLAHRAGVAPSRLFMPLAFGAILGGTTTLVGTPPNILTAAMLAENGKEPFQLFDFTPLGLIILAVGILFMVTFGRRLLPTRQPHARKRPPGDLAQAYQLREQLFSIRIPENSKMDGLTLGEVRLGTALSVQVAAILRNGKRQLAPEASAVLKAGDVLLVEGKLSDLEELLRVQGVEVVKAGAGALPRLTRGISAVRLALPQRSSMVGQTLKQLNFRRRFGVLVVGVQRQGEVLKDSLADLVLSPGDEILAIGSRSQIRSLSSHPELVLRETGLTAVRQLQEQLYLIHVPPDSPLVGSTVGQSRMGELVGVTVGGLIREGETRLAVSADEVIRGDDQLLIAGEPDRILSLLEMGEIRVDEQEPEPQIESGDIGVVEAVVAPRSSIAGKSLRQLNFRDRYGLQVLALWREGEALHTQLADRVLRFGDALLLQGPRSKIQELTLDADLIVLVQAALGARRTDKAVYALGGLLLMVALVVLNVQPIHVAAFTAAALVVLAGALSMEEAYRAIEWRAIFLVAAILPLGIAMKSTGAASLLAGNVASLAGPLGPYVVLGSLVFLSSLLSQGLDGAPAVVLLTPVVLQAAQDLNLSPYPLMMGVGLAASAAFMTPFSHKANLLVMSAGGYRTSDYIKVGTPLTIVLLALLVALVPLFFPF